MSYDILIFESGAVTDEGFPQWWDRVSRWEEPHHYDSIERATPAIRSFYRDLVRTFPPFNGPDALSDDEVDARLAQGLPVADYTISEDLVYVGVSWSATDVLVVTASELARRPTPAYTLVIPFSRATTETFSYCSTMVADGRSSRRRG